jgi:hypothetical protein
VKLNITSDEPKVKLNRHLRCFDLKSESNCDERADGKLSNDMADELRSPSYRLQFTDIDNGVAAARRSFSDETEGER